MILGAGTKNYYQGNFFGLGGDLPRVINLTVAAHEERLGLTIVGISSNITFSDTPKKLEGASEVSEKKREAPLSPLLVPGRASLFYGLGSPMRLTLASFKLLSPSSMQLRAGLVLDPSIADSATSGKKRKLWGVLSQVLRLVKENIGLNDNFYLRETLGFPNKTRIENHLLVVKSSIAHIFQKQTLYDMMSIIKETDSINTDI
ncbi:hypothetical protein NM208_g12153 [Fusarium decemcellulare]|uniref:Uncharacterized protein n=1 Tax=Fusarium decemcellulare TaxID=57161 RepID=A0ACC1RRT2_9HYPO|nr:hypothetical protein NM208_g12153 [Fusarium decemcellulare]